MWANQLVRRFDGYTYADYLQWDNGNRLELIEGSIVDMTPAPSRLHQEILMELGRPVKCTLLLLMFVFLGKMKVLKKLRL